MKVLGIAGSGGHMTELLALLNHMPAEFDVRFISNMEVICGPGIPMDTFESYNLRTPVSLINLIWKAYRFLRRNRPDVIVSTGAEIAIPFILVGKLLFQTKVIYVECSAQVYTKSRTGRFCYYFADRFYVQWPSLLPMYGKKARFAGGFLCYSSR